MTIIEGLIAVIILLGLFVGYRGFFGKKDVDSGLGGGLDASQLEKTLQKILENQAPVKKTGDAALEEAFKEGGVEGHPESPQEVEQLKVSLSENIKELEVLRAQLQISEKKVAELQVSGEAAPAAGAAAAVDTTELDNKIKDLEARLAEYEIISEDIADLSRYKEENEQLKTEITTLKESPASAKASAGEPAPVAPVAAAPVAEAEPTPEPVAETIGDSGLSEADVDAALAAAQAEAELNAAMAEAEATPAEAPTEPEVAAAPAPEQAAPPAQEESIIDDELMKEFAAAVEGQKNKALDSAAEKAGKGEQAAGKTDEDAKLMDEFENFVNKKS
ncbi:hypothetical protein [Bdellovibrio sp. HCB288]|uniref:hypothetical protein n=1 Tax=Bdellovibrio sp. HCB288 TaxID=3394355 RepID=UPI0039B397AB